MACAIWLNTCIVVAHGQDTSVMTLIIDKEHVCDTWLPLMLNQFEWGENESSGKRKGRKEKERKKKRKKEKR